MTLTVIPKKTIDAENKESVVRILKTTLEEAERGEIGTVIVIAEQPSGHWVNRTSNTVIFSEAIGRLEITKQEWIKAYLEPK